MGTTGQGSPEHVRHTDERRRAISQTLVDHSRASVHELSRKFGVSQVSIRRDLEFLEGMGLIRRVHGGAETLMRPGQTSLFDVRLLQNDDVKRAIGKAAAALIAPGSSIMLDSGTTVLEVARNIPPTLLNEGGLTIVTRSLVAASELRKFHNTRLIVLGGIYVPKFDVFVGSQVESALQSIHVDILFMGIDGVTCDRGLTTDNVLEASLYKIMVRCASRVVVVTDSTKIGVNQLQAILSFDEVHTFITDSGASDSFVRTLRDQGTEVLLVPRP